MVTGEKRPTVLIYADGACVGNPGPGGYAAVLLWDNRSREITGGVRRTTNNRMELRAAIVGFEALRRSCAVTLYTDSTYVANGVNRRTGRTYGTNADLWGRLCDLAEGHDARAVWVRGHDGDPFNERAHSLAEQAARNTGWPADDGYEGAS